MKLKDTSGVWVDESSQIESMFVNEFTARFKTAQTSIPNVQLDAANLVTLEDNENYYNRSTIQKLKMQFFK